MIRLEQAALSLAAGGYSVHPLRPRAKVPATPNGFKDGTRDERRIREWWAKMPDANVGIACGFSRLVVLDIDTKAGADPREVLARFDRAGAPVIGTGVAPKRCKRYPQSLAGRRGVQVYFRGDMASAARLTIPGVEIKGAGGYVVAPPSAHPSGVEYVGDLPPVDELPAVPHWLRALVPTARPARVGSACADRPTSVDGILDTVRSAPVGNRNHVLYWGARRIRDHIDAGSLSATPAVAQLHDAALEAGLPEYEVARTIRSALAGSVAA